MEPKLISERFTCPISRECLQDPVIYSDGYTYNRWAITQWLLTNPNQSPVLIGNFDPIIVTNAAVKIIMRHPKFASINSLADLDVTYIQPMVLMEDGNTYDLNEIETFFHKKVTEQAFACFARFALPSPKNSLLEVAKYTLVPNRLLYPEKVPCAKAKVLDPLPMEKYNPEFARRPDPAQRFVNLVNKLSEYTRISQEEGVDVFVTPEGMKISESFNSLARIQGLITSQDKTFDCEQSIGPNFTRFDCSGYVLTLWHFSSMTIKYAKFHKTNFIECTIDRVRFFKCDFEETLFKDCIFGKSHMFFTLSSVKNATFKNCTFEWSYDPKKENPLENLKERLKYYGALHTETIWLE